MTSSSDRAALPVALTVSVLLMVAIAALGGPVAGPDVLGPGASSTSPQPATTVPTEEPEEGEESVNETYLREALGSDFEIEGNELIAETSDGLPDELTAYATVVVQSSEADGLTCEDAADDANEVAPGNDGVVMTECEERTVDGRGPLLVQTVPARHSASGSSFGERTVRHLRADGDVVIVNLSVLGRPSGGSTSELEDEVSAWLDALEKALIEAALDDRMRAAP